MTPLLTIDAPRNGGRVIVIGDIHGCIDELQALLTRLAPKKADLVISAGDIVRKGPRPDLCLELWRDRGYLAVVGNNEQKLLRSAHRPLVRWLLPPEDRLVARRPDLLEYMAGMPVVIDIPSIDMTVVHGGLMPGMRVTSKQVAGHGDDLIRLRYVRQNEDGWVRVPKGLERTGDVLWSDVWRGDRTVLYGHTPVQEPRVDKKAIGLDTGCVYGGDLSAAVFERGRWRVEQVPARRAYAQK